MKTVIICSDTGLQKALEAQFQLRASALCWVAPDQPESIAELALAGDEEPLLIIDAASLSQGQSQQFSAAAFEHAVHLCARRGWPYLLLSDCRVFPGGKQRFREVDAVEPNSAEGTVLAQREQFLAAAHPQHIVLRTGPLLATSGDNVLMQLLALLRAGGAVPASSEARFCPVAIDDIARVVAAIADQLGCAAQCWGYYHYNSSDAASAYEFAEAVLAAASQYWPLAEHAQIQAAALSAWSGSYPQLNCHLLRDTFGIQQLPWRKAIPELLKQVHAGESS